MNKTLRSALSKSLHGAKKVLKRNKYIRHYGRAIIKELLPNHRYIQQHGYDYIKYYPTISQYNSQQKRSKELAHQPLISVVMPTYNSNIQFLEQCIDSVLVQSYHNWELCIADDASSEGKIIKTLQRYAEQDSRIKFVARKENGHISLATNSAIALASGEFIALLDHDDILWPNALFEVAKTINENPESDLIYSDEDKIDESGHYHHYPFFKPAWSPEFLESCNYITHFSCLRSKLVAEVGGFRQGFEGAQDWDIIIRVSELTQHIVHIPKVLYSWRVHSNSTALNSDVKPYVFEAQYCTLEDHISRLGRKGIVESSIIQQHKTIGYSVPNNISINIFFHVRTLDSITLKIDELLKKAGYQNIFVSIICNSQQEGAIHEQLSEYQRVTKVYTISEDRNFLEECNMLISKADADYIVFSSDYFSVISPNWATRLLADAQFEGIGAVGGAVLDAKGEKFVAAGATVDPVLISVPLMSGISISNLDFTQVLYTASRRNVLLLSEGLVMVNRKRLLGVGGLNSASGDYFIADLCLSFKEKGFKNIYTPFIEVGMSVSTKFSAYPIVDQLEERHAMKVKWEKFLIVDPYYNINFRTVPADFMIK